MGALPRTRPWSAWSPWTPCLLGVESRRRGRGGLEAVVISVRGGAGLVLLIARVVVWTKEDQARVNALPPEDLSFLDDSDDDEG